MTSSRAGPDPLAHVAVEQIGVLGSRASVREPRFVDHFRVDEPHHPLGDRVRAGGDREANGRLASGRCSGRVVQGSISRTVLVDAELVGVDDAGADRRHDRRQEVEVDFLAPPSLSRWYSAIDTAAAPATPAIESARPKGRVGGPSGCPWWGEATHRLDEGAEGRAGGIGAALPEAGDPQQDQTRVVSGEDVVAEPPAL